MLRRAARWTFARYVAFQVPGWIAVACLAWWLVAEAVVERWVAALGCALYVIKDLALYPRVRQAYAVGEPSPAALLVGRTGAASARIDPTGYVRIGAELWRAELVPGSAAIERGARVRILEVRGLTLIVESC